MTKTTLSPSGRAGLSGEVPVALQGYQAAAAVAALGGILAPVPCALKGIRAKALVCGSSGATTAQVKVDGVIRASVTIDNADPDGTIKTGGYVGAGSILGTTHTSNVVPIAQVETIGVTGNSDGTWTVTVNGHAYSYVASSKTAAQIQTALLAAIAGGTDPVTAAAVTSTTFSITANVAGVPFTIATTSPSSALTITHSTANTSAVAEVSYVQIVAPDAVTFVVTADGVIVGSYAATSADTVGTIRDALIAQVNAAGVGLVAAVEASDTLQITAPTAGTNVVIAASCIGPLPVPADALVSVHVSAAATGATGVVVSAALVQDFA